MTTPASSRPWLPYVLPMATYLAFLMVESNANRVWMYPLKTTVVAGLLWWFRPHYRDILRGGGWGWGMLIGTVAIVQWIALDPFYPKLTDLLRAFETWASGWMNSPPPAPPAPAFDPTQIEPPTLRFVFLNFRIFGAVVVVAFMEELFWRGFLIRWIESEDFRSVPVGLFTWKSFAVTVLLFGAEHDQWLAGLVCGALYNWLLYRTKSLWACVVAHAVSNALLAGWVLARGDWRFW
jgi:hypothetical protein